VSEKRVLRIFGPERDEVIGSLKEKLHNLGLHKFYSSPSSDQVKENEMAGHVARIV
jgi:hypothetical protein